VRSQINDRCSFAPAVSVDLPTAYWDEQAQSEAPVTHAVVAPARNAAAATHAVVVQSVAAARIAAVVHVAEAALIADCRSAVAMKVEPGSRPWPDAPDYPHATVDLVPAAAVVRFSPDAPALRVPVDCGPQFRDQLDAPV
jgi:hypothetical protein